MNQCLLLFLIALSSFNLISQTVLLDNFTTPTTLTWQIVNDGVMGGISSSQMEMRSDGIGLFSGNVSLENNGGFASTRALLTSSPKEAFTKVLLKVKGDGKKYSFRIRTDRNFDGVSYKQDFITKEQEWQEIELPLADFLPTWRGRQLRNIEPIEAPQIRQIGFLVSDKQEGDFALLVDWIRLE